jgi:hypothetical protein
VNAVVVDAEEAEVVLLLQPKRKTFQVKQSPRPQRALQRRVSLFLNKMLTLHGV